MFPQTGMFSFNYFTLLYINPLFVYLFNLAESESSFGGFNTATKEHKCYQIRAIPQKFEFNIFQPRILPRISFSNIYEGKKNSGTQVSLKIIFCFTGR